jgi:hypothetical protein
MVTHLTRDRFPPEHIYPLYRLRWHVELLFKEWKSYCNLHRFDTTEAPIAEGLTWAALAVCIGKRVTAKATQTVFDVAEISTSKTVMIGRRSPSTAHGNNSKHASMHPILVVRAVVSAHVQGTCRINAGERDANLDSGSPHGRLIRLLVG